MKDVITRKIGYYTLRLALNQDRTAEREPEFLKSILAHISAKRPTSRRRDLDGERFYYLSDIETLPDSNGDIQTLVFKSASYGRLPRLLERETLAERDNPRDIMEGEMTRTHAVIRYFNEEAILLLEEFTGGITARRMSFYLDDFASDLHASQNGHKGYKVEETIIPKGDFLEELNKLKRVQAGTITISKRYLGGEHLNFSDRLLNVQDAINIDIKSERNTSILEPIKDFYKKFRHTDSKIERIRISGRNEENYPAKLDTEIIKKADHLTFETDILTKEVKTPEVLSGITQLIRDF